MQRLGEQPSPFSLVLFVGLPDSDGAGPRTEQLLRGAGTRIRNDRPCDSSRFARAHYWGETEASDFPPRQRPAGYASRGRSHLWLRPQPDQMADRKHQIGAVHRIEMQVLDAVVDEVDQLFGAH